MAINTGRLQIVLFGNFGTGNLGNEATLQAILHNFRRYVPNVEVSCICPDPGSTELTHGMVTFPTRASFRRLFNELSGYGSATEGSAASTGGPQQRNRWLSPIARLKVPFLEPYRWLKGLLTLWGKDAVVLPGTGLLTDAYTLFDWGPYDLFRWSVTAKLCRCKLLFVSVGAGPLYGRAGRFFVRIALWLADFRSYRDESSKQYLKEIGFPTRNDPVYPDLVFSLPKARLTAGGDGKGQRLVVGLGLMCYAGKYSVEKPTNSVYANYLETLLTFVKWLLARDYDIRLLIGDLGDTSVTREFKSMLKERLVTYEGNRIVDEPVTSVKDLLSQVAATDLVVATRFHNVLLSLVLNKPVISISFHHKCSSLMSQMGLSEYCQDINNLRADELIEQFCRLRQNAGSLRLTIRERVQACRDALDEQYGTILRQLYPESQRGLTDARDIRCGS